MVINCDTKLCHHCHLQNKVTFSKFQGWHVRIEINTELVNWNTESDILTRGMTSSI